jgi:hypothetical protein
MGVAAPPHAWIPLAALPGRRADAWQVVDVREPATGVGTDDQDARPRAV